MTIYLYAFLFAQGAEPHVVVPDFLSSIGMVVAPDLLKRIGIWYLLGT